MTISPERLRELIARADLSAKDRPQDRPTIAELESILNDTRDPPRPIEITPEGQIRFLARLDFADTAAALRELEQARTTLEGVAKGTHVIVPKEPTDAMLTALVLAYEDGPRSGVGLRAYRAMLSAHMEKK